MNRVKFIYFDVGGVLVDWSRAFHTAANRFHLKIEDIGAVFDEHHDQITKGLITSQELWSSCVKKYHIQNGDVFNFVASWVSDYRPIVEMHDLVKKLAAVYKIGLLSNIYQGMLPLLLKNEVIPKIGYDRIILSCDVGLMKPETDIYELAQEKTGVKANNILLVDDRPDFLSPAQQLGWHTFLFDNKRIDKSVDKIRKYLQTA
ncbi:HAD family phosphatase [Patescibacteria group bacterium]|nr:HAD family phosphatase [Patescibacteria group bacterium]MCL5091310.1 HAD family phosphatase [Patescibacteria group bacterium]